MASVNAQVATFLSKWSVPGVSISLAAKGTIQLSTAWGLQVSVRAQPSFGVRALSSARNPRRVPKAPAADKAALTAACAGPRGQPVCPLQQQVAARQRVQARHLGRHLQADRGRQAEPRLQGGDGPGAQLGATCSSPRAARQPLRAPAAPQIFGTGSILGTTYAAAEAWTSTSTNMQRLKAITVRHLLEHVAGGSGWNNNGSDGTGDPMFQLSANTSAQLISWVLKNRTISDTPGSLYSYSNFGCGLQHACGAMEARCMLSGCARMVVPAAACKA
jgi:hypothetical protein